MKTNLKKYAFLLGILVLMLNSCKKFGDVNIDPTRSSNLDPSLQLTNVQLRFSGDLEVNEKFGLVFTMPLVQQIGGIWLNRNGQFYIYDRNYLSSLWNNTYDDDIVNIVDAVTRTNNDPLKTNLNAVCRIMKVYEFARMTDVYGDIPYFEAGKAFTNGIIQPKFDRQEDIYNDFFKELTAASNQLDAAKDAVKGDLFYNGGIVAWKKFANSLRLRYAMRLVKINPVKAKAEALAAYTAGVFTSNADMCKIVHQDVQNGYNDIRGNGVSAAFCQAEVIPRLQDPFINQLNGTNDPRLKHIARYYIDIMNRPFDRIDITDPVKAVNGYKGVAANEYVWDGWIDPITINIPGVGPKEVVNNDQKAQLANFLIRNNAPFLHQTYAEVEFLLAEATVRWGVLFGGAAAEHYAKGIEGAMVQLSLFPGGPTISSTEINAFITSNSLLPGREIELINTQLWIALLLNGPEAYANWRRTGFPVLASSLNGESSVLITPRRFEYPIFELEQNAVNAAAAIAAIGPGGNTWANRVWWDKP
ncbi:SusD/RagB family nutrient-binding outer membrane lipoprotein [Pedobacter hiemivivus]|uniref:SusD/RagB family nutrient-binding outer membrane lipoprotein n=1 Tax=Pedobacter hiemivivus TaxID=2530454 RepID=A0A4U1GIF2_9SPHI|nr:SusD/RagB family nutrient-binding outer membrane lipoprotein [Pedobacter hiemivivus]TCC87134.1 SusD/RagB family nutrient-binding outer membrane lipoprotein [Pedobacter hiemivivus]TKC61212.1 SusD/RagB family nutrient-binding outer membrane lipoprotein [Pedobacter hiemivivus]